MSKKTQRPTRDFPAFFEHIKSKKNYSPAFCVDVGAARGTPQIYTAFPDAYHIVFEPLPDFHEALKKTMKPYKHEIHTCALMDKPSQRKLLRHPDQYGSSMMHTSKNDSKKLVTVPVTTLDDVMGDRDLSGGMLLKLDCQGADLFVLKGGLRTLKYANMVIIESSLFKFWGDHHPDFYEIVQFMYGHNFALYDILDGLFRPFDDALGQVDLAFVKKDGLFRRTHQW